MKSLLPSFIRLLRGGAMRRRAVLAGMVCGLVASAATETTRPFLGVTLIRRTETRPRPLRMNILQFDLTAPGLRFHLTPQGGQQDTVRQTTLDFLKQERAQIAVNAHFYVVTGTGKGCELVGLAASEGRVFSGFEPQPVVADGFDQSYAIVPFAPALNLDATNHAAIVHLDRSVADLRHVIEPVSLWTAVSGSAQIITEGVKTIPTYSGKPGGLQPLLGYSDSHSWYDRLRARTILGLSDSGRLLVLFTVDETGGSEGMTVGEAAELLIRDYGVRDAFNLDGGPSTTLAWREPVTDKPKLLNQPNSSLGGDYVGSNLAIFARPAPPALRAEVRGAGEVSLSWPATPEEWRLEQADKVAVENWQGVELPAQTNEGRLQVTLQLQGDTQFFRLRD